MTLPFWKVLGKYMVLKVLCGHNCRIKPLGSWIDLYTEHKESQAITGSI